MVLGACLQDFIFVNFSHFLRLFISFRKNSGDDHCAPLPESAYFNRQLIKLVLYQVYDFVVVPNYVTSNVFTAIANTKKYGGGV